MFSLINEELGWSAKGFREAFGEVLQEGLGEPYRKAIVKAIVKAIAKPMPNQEQEQEQEQKQLKTCQVANATGRLADRIAIVCALRAYRSLVL